MVRLQLGTTTAIFCNNSSSFGNLSRHIVVVLADLHMQIKDERTIGLGGLRSLRALLAHCIVISTGT